MKKVYLTVVIPVFNEEGNIQELYKSLKRVLESIRKPYEIIFVDDGSADRSFKIIAEISKNDKNVKAIKFLRNFGQTAALSAGFDNARGEIIITLDADLQNDPRDIPKLLKKIDEGFDLVSGWRIDRHKESMLTRRLPSIMANKVISYIVGFSLNDFGCTFKAYRREFIKPLKLYGEMHRFIPAYAFWYGAKITEIPVKYRLRKYGKSKYNLSRTYKVILDLLTVKFLESFITKPIYVFGTVGIISLIGGFFSVFFLIYNKIFRGISMIQSPLLLMSALFIILGTMFVGMGLLAEILVRTYYESQDKKAYIIKER